jgi:PAS domain S-box-containing protein/diguanylate cyclase (GGDEF)-like protein
MDSQSAALRVLMVEDSVADAELVQRSLRDLPGPVEHTRVASEAALRMALEHFRPDVILSDFSMPGFSGQEALKIANATAPDVPFLFVSGTIGEEAAIDALNRGAIDYVLKDNLRRLPSAIQRALDIARHRLDRSLMERALRESEERFRTIVENSQDWIWEIDAEGRMTYNNPAVERILGYPLEHMHGLDTLRFMHPQDREDVLRQLPEIVAEGRGWRGWRLRWLHNDGSERVLESSATALFDDQQVLRGFRGVDQDITARLQQETRIAQLARIHAVLSALGNAVVRLRDRQALLDQVCRIAVEQGGFKAACIGLATSDHGLSLAASCGDPRVIAYLSSLGEPLLESEAARRPGIRALRDGRHVLVGDISRSGLDPDLREQMRQLGVCAQVALPIGTPAWAVLGLYSEDPQEFDRDEIDLLERLTREIDYAVDFVAKGERLAYLAYHNPVSGLPNRSAFRERLQPMLQRLPMVVAVVDILRLGHINDSRGRGFGDELLRQTGERLQETMGADAIVAHPEQDAFLLAYPAKAGLQAEIERLDALIGGFDRKPFVVGDEQIFVNLHGGIALAPEHGEDAESLERNAMAALAEAEKRNVRIHAYSEDLRTRAARRVELERDLRRAIEEREFELYYQPKYASATRRLVGAEALLRWRHPVNGLISPAEFIPVLEETGLIVPVGRWVMRSALETGLAWREAGHPQFRIAVNVSARELRNNRFLAVCQALLEPHAADQAIDIEITESVIMDDIDHSICLLQGLRALGCRIAIDDFGTGYSSLNYLARLPTDTIKIDQSFVALLTQSPETMSLITNIITLAHSLSLDVVAEGVEDEEQAKLLRLLRCDVLQGYLLGRPLPAADFAAKLLDLR